MTEKELLDGHRSLPAIREDNSKSDVDLERALEEISFAAKNRDQLKRKAIRAVEAYNSALDAYDKAFKKLQKVRKS